MMLAGLLFLLSLTDGSASNYSTTTDPPHDLLTGFKSEENRKSYNHNCTTRDVVRHLNLTKNTENSMSRPGRYGSPTEVGLRVRYTAIVDVNEKDQQFVSSLLLTMKWLDESLTWNCDDFCGIYGVHISTESMWKPDLTIEEMIKYENMLQSPYVWVNCTGEVHHRISMVVTSTCKMEVYKFPFDVQSCDLTFKSIMHYARDMKLELMGDTNWTIEYTKEIMRTGSEWLFVDLKTENRTRHRNKLVFTITMRRRSVLYIANLLLPVMFFFCLDLASFLISDSSGEKLGFKVTVLLAVTVMQLILNDILPSTSSKVPLIAIYCIGMFGLMMISLFETILVIYLMEKDIEADEDQRPKIEDCEDTPSKVIFCSCCKELKKWTPCARVCDVSVDESPSELLSATKEGNSSEMTEESIALEKLSGEMKEVILQLNSREEAGKLSYWTRMAKTINKVFVIVYVAVASVFLVVIFLLWHS